MFMSLHSMATTGPFNYVNGCRLSPIKTSEMRSCPVVEPATGIGICDLLFSGEKDVDQAVSVASSAFLCWSEKSGAERGGILCKVAALIKENLDQIAKIEVLDSGKPFWEARLDVLASADTFYYFGHLAQTHCNLGQQLPFTSKAFMYTRREALGVCAAIGVWNFPFLTASWKAAPALACGNTVIFKPSEYTPLTAVILAEMLVEVGLPPGCFNVLQGDGEVGQLLCLHPRVAKVSFTGSVPVGSKVMAACSKGIKKVTLELGGKSPLIIFDDCNLDNAVKAAMMANFLSQGQVCSNATRIFVQKTIMSSFLNKFVSATKKLKIGDPTLDDTKVGASIHEEHAKKVLNFIKKAKEEGARVLCGGERVDLEESHLKGGYYLSPCILNSLHDDMQVVKEEVFGAVACILEFESEEEVLQRANNSQFGLAGGVFTQDIARAHRVAAALEAGIIWINNYNLYPPEIPFGGYKSSGIGRENGLAVIDHYTQLKSVYVELGNVDCPLSSD